MSQKTLTNLWNTLRWALILPVFVPLLYVSGIYYPFIVPKVVYFRTLVEFTLAFFAVYVCYSSVNLDFSILKRKIAWLPAIFLGASYLSSLLGIDFYHSFWSTYERMDGLFTLTHLVVYFYLLLLVFRKEDWERFFTANAVVGSLVALYAVGQHFGLAWFLDKADPRVKGTIGNPAFLASYLAMTAFFVFDLAKNAKAGLERYGWWSAFVTHALAIVWSQTRGVFVAVFVASVGYALLVAFSEKEKKKRTFALWILGVIALLGSLFYVYRGQIAIANIPMLSRVAGISLNDATTQSRLFIWRNSLTAFFEKPLLGYGSENFEYVYNKFYDPQKIGEEWFDRSHNVYVDELIHGGLIGLGTYLAILGFMFYLLWQYRSRDGEKAVLLILLLLVYAVQNFFVFDTISTTFLFWAIFAYLLSINPRAALGGNKPYAATVHMAGRAILAFTAGIAMISGYWANYLPVRANFALSEGYMYQIADIKRSTEALERGLSYGTFGDLGYGYQVYDMYRNKLEYGKIPPKDLKGSYDFSEGLLNHLVEKYPWDVRLYVYWGHIVEGRPKGTPYDEHKFAERMNTAIKLSPLRPQAYYMLANTYLNNLAESSLAQKKELNAKALEVLRRYADLVPHFAEPQFIVTEVASKAGEMTIAEEYFKRGDKEYAPEFGSAKRAAAYLVRLGDHKRADRYFEDLVKFQPGNLDALTDLAKIYYMNGKIDEAVETMNHINTIDPKYLEKEPELVNKVLNSYQR